MHMSCINYEHALIYWTYIPHKILLFIHFLLSLFGLINNTLFLLRHSKHLYFHGNSKILIKFIVLTNIVYSTSQLSNQIYQGIIFIIAKEPCDLYISNRVCLIFRLPSWTSITLITMFNLAIVLERLSATYLASTYEHRKPYRIIIYMLALSCTVGCGLFIYFSWDLDASSLHCSYWTSNSLRSVQNFCWLHVLLDIILLVIFVGNYRWNIVTSQRIIYDISTRYQRKENLIVLKIFKPIIGLHLGVHLIFCFSLILMSYLARLIQDQIILLTIMMALSVYPVYAMLAPFFLIRNLQKNKEQREQHTNRIQRETADCTSNYFKQFNSAWR